MSGAKAQELIRNFCIIAHIDHGKSTLADRLLEYTGALSAREMTEQVLDQMDLERERGITIKLQAVRLSYKARDGREYVLNLIDTPGHVDFTYEVSRSLAACEGALLVIDASQGIEAQTLANVYLAMEHDLEIILVINKVDLPSADPERVKREIEEVIGLDASEAIMASAKTGLGTEEILEAIVKRIPAPAGAEEAPLRALIFDSHFDAYRGAVPYIRVVEGNVSKGMEIKMMATGKIFEVNEVGVFTPAMKTVERLSAGEVGFITASIKNVKDTRVGDTVTGGANPAREPLPGYRKVTPMVFCGLYPVETSQYEDLRDALEKLKLNDASLIYEPETSQALGFGFRCGFLGLLHMEIIQERLEREYSLELITTAPSVVYRVTRTDGEVITVDNPTNLPPTTNIEVMEEPFVRTTVMVPSEYVGPVMELAQEKRGQFINMEYLSENRVMLIYELPLSEIIYDFFDMLKSRTRGYASMDYELSGYRESDLVKLDVLIAGDTVDALSCIVHRDRAHQRGRALVEKLRQLIPRQLFEVPIQAAIGNKVIARENVKAMRKNVLEKCYGGDITRKRKLLEKQKEGKKRMKQVGNVEIPQEAFMAVLQVDK
ncbi:GTP-binding protein LepA [Clostridiales bacterium PH28_bin88]|nr:GTP-binding protein LepA [Clostridiales bacterium PH28_bin88]